MRAADAACCVGRLPTATQRSPLAIAGCPRSPHQQRDVHLVKQRCHFLTDRKQASIGKSTRFTSREIMVQQGSGMVSKEKPGFLSNCVSQLLDETGHHGKQSLLQSKLKCPRGRGRHCQEHPRHCHQHLRPQDPRRDCTGLAWPLPRYYPMD